MDIIIETPKGSNLKYSWDKDQNLFKAKKKLAAGLVFPFDFGFIPGTEGEDGDPLDIMVIAEFTTFTGCVLDCRLIGCIQAIQGAGDKKLRNDRYLGVPGISGWSEEITSIEDLPAEMLRNIESFIINYISAEGKKIKLLGNLNAKQAYELMKSMEKKH
jgi:inorganic pyrophosphatase